MLGDRAWLRKLVAELCADRPDVRAGQVTDCAWDYRVVLERPQRFTSSTWATQTRSWY